MRLHLAKIAPNYADLNEELLTEFTPAHVAEDLSSAEEAWNLAQYVDLVEAIGAAKGDVYHAARAALGRYVAKGWQQPVTRNLFGRSASLMAFVNEQLSKQEQELTVDVRQELRAWAA